MKKLFIIIIVVQYILISCNETAEKRTERWIDAVSGKAYSYEEDGETMWIGFSDYNFIMQELKSEDDFWGALGNGLLFIGSAALSEYIESPKKDTALFKFGDDDDKLYYFYFEKKGDVITAYMSENTNDIIKSTNTAVFKYDENITKKYASDILEMNDYFATNK